MMNYEIFKEVVKDSFRITCRNSIRISLLFVLSVLTWIWWIRGKEIFPYHLFNDITSHKAV